MAAPKTTTDSREYVLFRLARLFESFGVDDGETLLRSLEKNLKSAEQWTVTSGMENPEGLDWVVLRVIQDAEQTNPVNQATVDLMRAGRLTNQQARDYLIDFSRRRRICLCERRLVRGRRRTRSHTSVFCAFTNLIQRPD